MNKNFLLPITTTIICMVISITGCSQKPTSTSAADKGQISMTSLVKSLEKIGEGAFPKWSPDGSLIAFTKESTNQNDPHSISYDIYTIKPDGTDIKCLTCNKSALSNARWKGQPYWHPSGKYIVFTAESAQYPRKGIGTAARPGLGRNHNVWIMTNDGSKFWQITDYPDNWGVIRPSFSHDGKTLYWNEEFSMEKYPNGKPTDPDDDPVTPGHQGHPGNYWGWENYRYRKGEEAGAWRVKLANISFENGEPKISNIRAINPPDGFTLIEGTGFTPFDNGFIYSYANLKENGGQGLWGDIYISDLSGTFIQRLTNTPFVHDENPEFSLDGKHIIWNQSKGDPGEGEELWLMSAGGSNKVRLTYFTDPDHEEYAPNARQITESTWSSDGKKIVFGHVNQKERGGIHIPSTLYLLTFAENSGDTIKVKSIKTIKENGGRVDWSHSGNNLIAFDRLGEDGYYDVYVINPDGSGEKCLTCGKQGLPQKHNGNPAWHPSGEWIVFQSVDPDLIPAGLPDDEIKMLTNPGAGWLNNLWLMDENGQHFYQLTNVGRQGGVLHPHFSHNGKKLLWAERLGKGEGIWGEWALKVADFVMSSNRPHLENIKAYQPALEKHRFYESHGFSLDDSKIIFSGNPEANQKEYGLDIYVFDLTYQKLTKLTDTSDEWDEHAILSPDGNKIVWMSSQDIENPDFSKVKTDFWIMNSDGSNKQRLTYFNNPDASEYISIPDGVVAADSSWGPDGTKIVVYVKTAGKTYTGSNLILELENSPEPQKRIPYYFIAIHNEPYHFPGGEKKLAEEYNTLKRMIAKADQYNIKLTLMFTAQWADYISKSPERIVDLESWKKQGHEIAGHHHSIYHGNWDGYTDYSKEEAIAQRIKQGVKPEEYIGTLEDYINKLEKINPNIKSGCMNEEHDKKEMPDEIIYATCSGFANCGEIWTRLSDVDEKKGQNKYILTAIVNGILRKWLSHYQITTPERQKIAQTVFDSIDSSYVYGVVTHSASGVQEKEYYNFLKFLHIQDPEGKKSRTVSEIIDQKLLPEK